MRQAIRRELRLSSPPPSVNEATRTIVLGKTSRKVATEQYKSWLQASHFELMRQPGIGKEQGWWRADVLITGNCNVDLDNMAKGIMDVMRKAEKTPDDRYLVDLRLRFGQVSGVSIIIERQDPDVWAKIRKVSTKMLAQIKKAFIMRGTPE